jgi:alpha-ketoglutarate-dependent taurine dioxygenase
MEITIKGVIGAEVSGVSLAQEPGPPQVREIKRLLERYGVLIFKDQTIAPGQQVAFTRKFGSLARSPRVDGRVPGYPDVFAVGNSGGNRILFCPETPDGPLDWHTDQIHRKTPCHTTLLYALQVPPTGGDTLFACTYSAYDHLDPERKAVCDQLTAAHSPLGLMQYLSGQSHEGSEDQSYDEFNDATRWPLVRHHPLTGRPALYFGSHVTVGIEGWPRAKARELIEDLTAHTTQPQFQYRHRWQAGDAVFIDNRRVLHAGTYYDMDRYERLLHRTMTAETEPLV